jgi:hypothetical protein
MANPIPLIRFNQMLCRPVGLPYAKSEAEAIQPQFKLTKWESAATNLSFRLAKSSLLTPDQQSMVSRIQDLASDIWGLRINGLRLVIANLVLDSFNRKAILNVETTDGSNTLLKMKDVVSGWNERLIRLYYLLESSGYDLSQDITDLVKSEVTDLSRLIEKIGEAVFTSNLERITFRASLSLLNDAAHSIDALFPCLLLPIPQESTGYLSEKQIRLYQKLLHFSLVSLRQYELDSKKLLQNTKEKELRERFIKGISEWKRYIELLQLPLKKLLPLQERLKVGDQSALFELQETLRKFDHYEFHRIYQQTMTVHFKEINLLSKEEAGFLSISDSYNLTYLHAVELLSRFTIAIFTPLKMDVDRCVNFVEAVQPLMALRSAHLTPLDLFRSHWSAPYLKESKLELDESAVLASIEMICQILRNPSQNVYGKQLSDLPLIIGIMKNIIPPHYPQEPVELLEALNHDQSLDLLLPWLNAPLLHQTSEGSAREAIFVLLKQLHFYLRNCSFQIQSLNKSEEFSGSVIVSDVVLETIRLRSALDSLLGKNGYDQNAFEHFCKETHSLSRNYLFGNLMKAHFGEVPPEFMKMIDQDMTLLEDLRMLYARPFLSMGSEFLLDDSEAKSAKKTKRARHSFQPPRIEQSIPKPMETEVPALKPLQLGELFESLMPKASAELKVALSAFVDCLKEPYLLEPIYQAAARCLEAHLKPSENHDLTGCALNPADRDWLAKMQKFLPITFSLPALDAGEFEEDMQRMARMFGLDSMPCSALEMKRLPDAPVPEVSSIHDRIWELSLQTPLKSCHKLIGETRLQTKIRDGFIREILDAIPSLLEDIEPLIALCEQQACPPVLLKFLMMRTGQVMEGALKLHLTHEAIPSDDHPDQHCLFEKIGNRPRMYDHDLVRTHKLVSGIVTLDDDEQKLLQRFSHFALWTRYGHESQDTFAQFLRNADLLYRDFHSDDEVAELKRLGFDGDYRQELFRIQRELLVPEIKALLSLVHKLLIKRV